MTALLRRWKVLFITLIVGAVPRMDDRERQAPNSRDLGY